jgi:hypothetical protein
MVALMSGGTCVSGRNDSGTYDGGTKVAPPFLEAQENNLKKILL